MLSRELAVCADEMEPLEGTRACATPAPMAYRMQDRLRLASMALGFMTGLVLLVWGGSSLFHPKTYDDGAVAGLLAKFDTAANRDSSHGECQPVGSFKFVKMLRNNFGGGTLPGSAEGMVIKAIRQKPHWQCKAGDCTQDIKIELHAKSHYSWHKQNMNGMHGNFIRIYVKPGKSVEVELLVKDFRTGEILDLPSLPVSVYDIDENTDNTGREYIVVHGEHHVSFGETMEGTVTKIENYAVSNGQRYEAKKGAGLSEDPTHPDNMKVGQLSRSVEFTFIKPKEVRFTLGSERAHGGPRRFSFLLQNLFPGCSDIEVYAQKTQLLKQLQQKHEFLEQRHEEMARKLRKAKKERDEYQKRYNGASTKAQRAEDEEGRINAKLHNLKQELIHLNATLTEERKREISIEKSVHNHGVQICTAACFDNITDNYNSGSQIGFKNVIKCDIKSEGRKVCMEDVRRLKARLSEAVNRELSESLQKSYEHISHLPKLVKPLEPDSVLTIKGSPAEDEECTPAHRALMATEDGGDDHGGHTFTFLMLNNISHDAMRFVLKKQQAQSKDIQRFAQRTNHSMQGLLSSTEVNGLRVAVQSVGGSQLVPREFLKKIHILEGELTNSKANLAKARQRLQESEDKVDAAKADAAEAERHRRQAVQEQKRLEHELHRSQQALEKQRLSLVKDFEVQKAKLAAEHDKIESLQGELRDMKSKTTNADPLGCSAPCKDDNGETKSCKERILHVARTTFKNHDDACKNSYNLIRGQCYKACRSCKSVEDAGCDDEFLEAEGQREELDKAKAFFKKADKDGDGELTTDEMNQLLWENQNIAADFQMVGFDDMEDIGKTVAVLDEDGSGTMSFKEFRDGCKRMDSHRCSVKQKIEDALRIYATAGDGSSRDGSSVEQLLSPSAPRSTDCKFSEWGAWGSCSSSGTRIRTRYLAQNASGEGKACTGSLAELGQCKAHQVVSIDCMFGEWSAWSSCTKTCDGNRQRQRSISQLPKGFGKPCEAHSLLEVQPCNVKGEFCGRTCENCMLSEWSDWSACTRSCEGGQKMRDRRIVQIATQCGTFCQDVLSEIAPCNLSPCVATTTRSHEDVDCEFGLWAEWMECPVTCGAGQSTRHRQILQESNGLGKPCEGILLETKQCSKQSCPAFPVDCVFDDWRKWGDCTIRGFHSRTRQILRVSDHGGVPCAGSLEVEEPCAYERCTFSDWSEWTECSTTCGVGQKRRKRQLLHNSAKGCKGDVDITMGCMRPAACTEVPSISAASFPGIQAEEAVAAS
eukprot:TRINITY_DN77871_c0_g1_i1.p1 TRINITY_DN77871_c0_g1~~TRINITY_DN77871_c0_g1_i1.p1  ORF type:complete len:1268 (+),score=214.15 TRINITY_DN77871_c0_g1_i1:67-3870(+)